MNFGLTDEALSAIRSVFEKHPEVERVVIFGSRAMGHERANSDIDLAVWGEVDDLLLGRILGELDELPLPYTFDGLVYDRIQHPALKEHIDRFSQSLFARAR